MLTTYTRLYSAHTLLNHPPPFSTCVSNPLFGTRCNATTTATPQNYIRPIHRWHNSTGTENLPRMTTYSMLLLLLWYGALQIVLRRKIIFTWYKVIIVRYINTRCAGIGYNLLVILSLNTVKTVFVLFRKQCDFQTSRFTSELCSRSNWYICMTSSGKFCNECHS
jgi:hypothetical protein